MPKVRGFLGFSGLKANKYLTRSFQFKNDCELRDWLQQITPEEDCWYYTDYIFQLKGTQQVFTYHSCYNTSLKSLTVALVKFKNNNRGNMLLAERKAKIIEVYTSQYDQDKDIFPILFDFSNAENDMYQEVVKRTGHLILDLLERQSKKNERQSTCISSDN